MDILKLGFWLLVLPGAQSSTDSSVFGRLKGTVREGVAPKYANATQYFLQERDLYDMRDVFARQSSYCLRSGDVPCANDPGSCCPTGYSCNPTQCCPPDVPDSCGSGTCYDSATEICCDDGTHCPLGTKCSTGYSCCDSGEELCGNGCYDPESEICCDDGTSCDSDEICCGDLCCYNNIATCGAANTCEGVTCYATSTYEDLQYTSTTTTLTKITPPSEAFDFSCPPVSATDSSGYVLALDEDCSFSLEGPSATPSPTSSPAAETGSPLMAMNKPRQASECYYTSVEYVTTSVYTTYTYTTTVSRSTPEQEFSCAPLTVTNSYGDTLALGDDCSFEYTPDSGSSSGSSSGSGTNSFNSGSSSGNGGGTGSGGLNINVSEASNFGFSCGIVGIVTLNLFVIFML